MTKEEITICLTNALERNQSIENAIESLINAGFMREEVEEVAREISRVSETAKIISASQPPMSQSSWISPPSPTSGSVKPLPTVPSAHQREGAGMKLFIIVGVIIFIVLILASWGAYVYLTGRSFF